MTKERDLLRRVVGWWDDDNDLGYPDSLMEEIRSYLAEPDENPQDEGIIDFCDTHCTWLDHHPICPLKALEEV